MDLKERLEQTISVLRKEWKKQHDNYEIDHHEFLGRMFALDLIESELKGELHLKKSGY
jgi:hypothetical protein